MIEIIHPETSQEWEAYFLLRYEVLRKPWNQPPGSEKDQMEQDCVHLMALCDGVPAGVCRIQYNTETEAQIRFMGVDEKFRGKNIGRLLLNKAEEIINQEKRRVITLQARENAVPFYLSCGYSIVEKSFLMWDLIQHYRMEKQLISN